MLALYLPRLPMGGIERATITLANYWASEGRAVTILLDRKEGDLLFAISPRVTIAVLDASRTLWALPRLVRWLRRNRPAVLHSALPHNNLVALAAGLMTGTRITIAEHSLFRDKVRIDRKVARIVPLARLLYPHAKAILAASDAVAEELSIIAGIPLSAVRVVGNPVVPDDFDPSSLEKPPDMPQDGMPIFIAVGRMTPIKDFPTLLRAFRFVLDRRPAHIMILGDGAERARLRALAAKLGLGDRLGMPGVVDDPWPYIAHASVLVCSSISEGFGNIIVEAMACGTQIVSTRCGGPTDLLQHGDLGYLANIGDAESLGSAMLMALDQPTDRSLLRNNAARFSVSAVAARYADALIARHAA